jgi:hypothetical protein
MLVTIGNNTRRLAVTSGTGPVPMVRSTLTARDPLLATLAQEGSPITVRVGDAPPLVLPPSPLIGEFVSLCASGGGQEEGAADANRTEAAQEEAPASGNESTPAR